MLDEYGVKGRLLKVIQALYMDIRARPRQGDKRGKRAVWIEVKLSTGDVGVLLFVDDMVVMAESVERLQSNLQVMSDVLSRWKLKVNWGKTKVMRAAREREECEVAIEEQQIE